MTHLSHTEEENGADEVWGREEEGEEVGGGRGLGSDLYYNLWHKV